MQIWVSVVLFKIGFDIGHWIHLHKYPYPPYLVPAIQFHVAQSGHLFVINSKANVQEYIYMLTEKNYKQK